MVSAAGANIFLTEEGNMLKLGDFGCAVRLRGHQTEVGELAGIVGTHAYMAPEIFQSSEGHGRAADVWSVGCVVIEMATGKRPWPEYDSSVQIMFRVGMGQSPTIPSHLSEEGHEFLTSCFIHDPKKRATTAQLLDHTFVKVDTGEDCPSLPLFSHPPFVPYMKLLSNT
ncbi:Mitogen-activated protein kinase kinase kinase 4 [Portunus trituberculatus]|uniref:Mitogen-activated protein kinase kinase kinase 4 n=1 Tax=Portunus trituberculatus TaxID=210409 RepID=A0A5B7D0Q0_PORTR|nr:Mitogen-activated protein kinase kinase kinase 4 [Portunus trituberculatus]